MNKKKMKWIKNSTYKRFFFSFVWVLIIPIMAFTLIYTQYYEKMYKNKILSQSENSLELSMQELEQHIQEFYTISVQNSLIADVQSYNLRKNVLNTKIKNLLASETITHSFIDCIEYYNEAVLNSIYTQQGTCTPQYYRKYTIMGQDMYTLPEYLEKMEMSGFIRGENMVEDSHSQNPNLQYVVKMAGSDRAHWIFTISDDELAKLLEEEQSVTILYDSEGNQLYPVQKIPDSIMEQIDKTLMKQLGSDLGKEYCKIFSVAEDESLQLVRVIHSNHLFLETNQFRIVFLLIVMLLLILGGVLVAFLSFYNNRPISELEDFCENKFSDIPDHIKGMDIFRFTLDKMEERVFLLEQKQKEERLLLQLIYGKNCKSECFKDALKSAGIFLKSECYRVIFVVPMDDNPQGINLSLYFEMLLRKEYELHLMEYSKQNMILAIIGMTNRDDTLLRNKLYLISQKMDESGKKGINMYVGGKCVNKEDIHWSYMQALIISQKSKKQNEDRIIFFEENANVKMRFVYPKLELDSLYDALVAANFHKASLITDVLVDMIREQSYHRFVCTTLCYDVINAYYRAQTELEFQKKDLKPEIDSKLIYGISDIEEMIHIIFQIRDQSRAYMEKGSGDSQPKDIAAKVIAFIDQNSKDRNMCVSMVADQFHMSISNLSHQFKALTNINISDYITDKKFIYVKELLLETNNSVQTIADMLGYNQTTSFIRKFKQYYGMTPNEYREFYQKEQDGTSNTKEREDKNEKQNLLEG